MNGVVSTATTVLAMPCEITPAVVLQVVRIAAATASVRPMFKTAVRSCAVMTSPRTRKKCPLVSATDRPSAAKTPTPSRINTGIATANKASGTAAPTRQNAKPAIWLSAVSRARPRTARTRPAAPRAASAGPPPAKPTYASATILVHTARTKAVETTLTSSRRNVAATWGDWVAEAAGGAACDVDPDAIGLRREQHDRHEQLTRHLDDESSEHEPARATAIDRDSD